MASKFKEEVMMEEALIKPLTKAEPRKYQLIYFNILVALYYHVAGLHGLYLALTCAAWSVDQRRKEDLLNNIVILFSALTFWLAETGIFAGAHRLWSHKSYKAKKPLQFFLMICQSIGYQVSVVDWARYHRIHHKYADTDADPHNASRGFFFSHVGWLFVKEHPEFIKRKERVDISDLLSNPYLYFQHKQYKWFLPFMAFVIPSIIPIYFWKETFSAAWNINMLRYIINLNTTFMINSIAHLWGNRPYDRGIQAAQNRTVFYLTLGEGSHNYHHVFPIDYRSDELGLFNSTTKFIDFCAFIGQSYDRQIVDVKTIKARAQRTGDGSVHGDQ